MWVCLCLGFILFSDVVCRLEGTGVRDESVYAIQL